MSSLLHILTSPRKRRSNSNLVAEKFIETYQKAGAHRLSTLDLSELALPRLNDGTLSAKYAVLHGEQHSDAQHATWQNFKDHWAPLAAADDLLISLPMWNFGVPYTLKHYIDVVTQPGIAFTYRPDEGYKGLLRNKRAIVILASGDNYTGQLSAIDYVTPYLKHWLGFIGIKEVEFIPVAPMLAPPEIAEQARAKAMQRAEELGTQLGKDR